MNNGVNSNKKRDFRKEYESDLKKAEEDLQKAKNAVHSAGYYLQYVHKNYFVHVLTNALKIVEDYVNEGLLKPSAGFSDGLIIATFDEGKDGFQYLDIQWDNSMDLDSSVEPGFLTSDFAYYTISTLRCNFPRESISALVEVGSVYIAFENDWSKALTLFPKIFEKSLAEKIALNLAEREVVKLEARLLG